MEILNDNFKEILEFDTFRMYQLHHLKKQTKELCLYAVIKEPLALKYVQDQTFEICFEACIRGAYALQYIRSNELHNDILTILKNAAKQVVRFFGK